MQRFIKFTTCFIIVILFSSCSAHSPELEKETEYTVVLTSYYDDSVLDALLEDINSRINAVYLDLETGNDAESDFSDLYYQLSCGSTCVPVVSSMEKDQAFIFGSEKPQKTDCEKIFAEDGLNNLRGVSIVHGNYSCVQTVEGNIGWVRFDKDFRAGMEYAEIQLTYWLWED